MNGKQMNTLLRLKAKHALYREDGEWYHHLKEFPGVFFDANGFIIFNTVSEYNSNSGLQKGKGVHITDGISSMAGYKFFSKKQLSIINKIRSPSAQVDSPDIEKRVSRLVWNDHGWVMPSGRFAKSTHKETHEARYGYGHEEWIFDTGKLIQGYHYGFLESVRKEQDAYSGNIYNVWLYSINGDTKKRFWIGEIKNLIVIDQAEADAVYNTYVEKGWIKEMEEQIKISCSNEKGFSNWKGVDVFNVKFKPNSIFVNDPYFELPDDHPIIEKPRYFFGHFRDEYNITKGNSEDNFEFTISFDNNGSDCDPQKKTHIRQPKAVEIIYWHKAISDSLTTILRQEHGATNVTREHLAGYGTNKIDIVVKGETHLTFYEIKTYNSIRTSIREAFGQLMEYCFFPNRQKAKELIIVTHLPADKQTQIYFNHLRNTFKLPIYYQSYDLDTKSLSEKC